MISLLNADFFQEYGLLIILAGALLFLLAISFYRRKKEDTSREELHKLIVPGVKVKTYGGVYGKVINISETTDGKVVLLETGEGKHVSYQSMTINAIWSLDDKQPVVLDSKEENVFVDLDKLEKERMAQLESQKAEEKPAEKKTTTTKKTTKK